MCGRFVVVSSPALLAERFGVDVIDDSVGTQHVPDYNVAPRAEVLVVRERDDRRHLSRLRWGLVPSWADDPSVGDRMINARSESLMRSRAYRRAFERRRALIPADGFYEWRSAAAAGAGGAVGGEHRVGRGRSAAAAGAGGAVGGEHRVDDLVLVPPPAGAVPRRTRTKQPVFVRRRDGEPMALAALWEAWKNPGTGEWLRTCAIVTTAANDLLMPVHDRMPVLVPEASWSVWLDRTMQDTTFLRSLLVPAPADELEMYPVSTLVNSTANNGPELVARRWRAPV